MAAFTLQEVENRDLDWWILSRGGICLYYKTTVLDADTDWLRTRDYEIKSLNAGAWVSERAMHTELASVFSFPPYYGNNLDALDECMLEDLRVPVSGGLVIILRQYDRFANGPGTSRFPGVNGAAHATLHIFAKAARQHMLTGRRFFTLVQSDDPHVSFDGLAAVNAAWNPREWPNKNRGL